MLNVNCPSCGKKLQIPENAVGRAVQCPACQHKFTVAGQGEQQEIPLAHSTPSPHQIPPQQSPPTPDMTGNQGNTWRDFLLFKKMITPVIIMILFWVGVAICIISSIAMMAKGNGVQAVMGFMVLVLGPVMVRIYCEILILFFRMNATLTDIHTTLKEK